MSTAAKSHLNDYGHSIAEFQRASRGAYPGPSIAIDVLLGMFGAADGLRSQDLVSETERAVGAHRPRGGGEGCRPVTECRDFTIAGGKLCRRFEELHADHEQERNDAAYIAGSASECSCAIDDVCHVADSAVSELANAASSFLDILTMLLTFHPQLRWFAPIVSLIGGRFIEDTNSSITQTCKDRDTVIDACYSEFERRCDEVCARKLPPEAPQVDQCDNKGLAPSVPKPTEGPPKPECPPQPECPPESLQPPATECPEPQATQPAAVQSSTATPSPAPAPAPALSPGPAPGPAPATEPVVYPEPQPAPAPEPGRPQSKPVAPCIDAAPTTPASVAPPAELPVTPPEPSGEQKTTCPPSTTPTGADVPAEPETVPAEQTDECLERVAACECDTPSPEVANTCTGSLGAAGAGIALIGIGVFAAAAAECIESFVENLECPIPEPGLEPAPGSEPEPEPEPEPCEPEVDENGVYVPPTELAEVEQPAPPAEKLEIMDIAEPEPAAVETPSEPAPAPVSAPDPTPSPGPEPPVVESAPDPGIESNDSQPRARKAGQW